MSVVCVCGVVLVYVIVCGVCVHDSNARGQHCDGEQNVVAEETEPADAERKREDRTELLPIGRRRRGGGGGLGRVDGRPISSICSAAGRCRASRRGRWRLAGGETVILLHPALDLS